MGNWSHTNLDWLLVRVCDFWKLFLLFLVDCLRFKLSSKKMFVLDWPTFLLGWKLVNKCGLCIVAFILLMWLYVNMYYTIHATLIVKNTRSCSIQLLSLYFKKILKNPEIKVHGLIYHVLLGTRLMLLQTIIIYVNWFFQVFAFYVNVVVQFI